MIAALLFISAPFLLYTTRFTGGTQANDMMTSLIPEAFRDRLYEQMNADKPGSGNPLLEFYNSKRPELISFWSTEALALSGDPIIQASDVCHTMQHWHTYQKYNARLFEERYIAYRKGVSGENPPWVGWYNGEIWFFDNYIIPLAKKLNDCGVFGVSYHEYLSYAQENRAEWARKGEEIVERLHTKVELKYKSFEVVNSDAV
jgi:hypothetical protein